MGPHSFATGPAPPALSGSFHLFPGLSTTLAHDPASRPVADHLFSLLHSTVWNGAALGPSLHNSPSVSSLSPKAHTSWPPSSDWTQPSRFFLWMHVHLCELAPTFPTAGEHVWEALLVALMWFNSWWAAGSSSNIFPRGLGSVQSILRKA